MSVLGVGFCTFFEGSLVKHSGLPLRYCWMVLGAHLP